MIDKKAQRSYEKNVTVQNNIEKRNLWSLWTKACCKKFARSDHIINL